MQKQAGIGRLFSIVTGGGGQGLCGESENCITGNQEESLCLWSSNDLKFQSPQKKYSREKSVTELDDFENEVVRRVVHSFNDEGEIPSSVKILVENLITVDQNRWWK